MGPDRHCNLINVLAVVVALDIVVALGAVYVRGDGLTGAWGGKRVAAGRVEAPSPLAAGNFAERRRATRSTVAPTTTTTAAPAPTTMSTAAISVPTSTTAETRARRSPRAATSRTPATASGAQQPGTLEDPVGDTVAAKTDARLAESRADIVRTAAMHDARGITFMMQLQRPTDPRHDERWAGNSTVAWWAVDTNGDSVADYEIEYFLVDEENVGGSVSRPGEEDAVCGVSSATYSADGYKLTVDPACLGNPPSFSYRASMSYETNPTDESADIATDTAPNKGWSGPVTRP